MAKASLKTRFEAVLIALGSSKCKVQRSRKYLMLTRPAGGFYYLGPSGSLRIGKSLATSQPASERFRHDLLEAYIMQTSISEALPL